VRRYVCRNGRDARFACRFELGGGGFKRERRSARSPRCDIAEARYNRERLVLRKKGKGGKKRDVSPRSCARSKSVRDRRAAARKSMAGIGRADTRGINLPFFSLLSLSFFFFRCPPTGCAFPIGRFPVALLSGCARPYRRSRKNSLLVRVSISNARSVKDTLRAAGFLRGGRTASRATLFLRRAARAAKRFRFGVSDVNIGNRFLSTLGRSRCMQRIRSVV